MAIILVVLLAPIAGILHNLDSISICPEDSKLLGQMESKAKHSRICFNHDPVVLGV